MRQGRYWLVALSLLSCELLSCEPAATGLKTQGTEVAPGPCGRGLLVMESDYQSSNVALLGFDGAVLSPSFAHSAALGAGYGVSLSGDAVPPGPAQSGASVALIDRTPSGVVHFIDVVSAEPSFDLNVDTGFRSNPHDYLALAPDKAYLTRYDSNLRPGAQPWDAGGDVVIVDPSARRLVGSIDLSSALSGEDPRFTPHPDRLLAVAGRVFVLLSAYARDYTSSAESRLVEIDPVTDALKSTLIFPALHGCTALALSPAADELAVACTGDQLAQAAPGPMGSGLLTIDISGAPREKARILAESLGSAPLGFGLDYVADGVVLLSTLGYRNASGQAVLPDTLVRLTLAGGVADTLRQESPFSLGDIRCAPLCGACFVSAAAAPGGSLLRYEILGAGALGAAQAITPETEIGLPARYLGVF